MARRSGAFALVAALCLLELARRGLADEPAVPAMFVFGDSTVDVGNNNFLANCKLVCRANYPRYGVDYPFQSPTGRFSNGYNLADQIAQNLGFDKSPPPYLSLPDVTIISQMSKGINFASGGSGLLDSTGGAVCTEVFNMSAQVQSFTSAVQKMGNGTADLISKSLIFINTGSNDLFEYTDIPSNTTRNDTEFLQSLVVFYKSHLKELYGAGARKFSVVSPSLVGCCPSQRAIARAKNDLDGYGCYRAANGLSRQLYPMLDSMLRGLAADLGGMRYSLADSVRMAELIFNGTVLPGANFTVLDKPCCGGGGGTGVCNRTAALCEDRRAYLFWDNNHPTEAASRVAALELFADPGVFVHPINVRELAELRT
ncbi:GDSL esterase/lipase At4g16230-like [Oryza brachyantha]|uniref:GDSL esterase/lipase n=1 Tax=Oryza brachyantha TaxID=4533 RepID=J3M0E1_ORYBR|nr:GDSL esterase/lipase At4g16230-like [Oryza brachyantha]